MTTHPFDILALENGAKIIFTPCPGTKGPSLEDSIKQLHAAGTNMIITTMFDTEMKKHEVTELPKISADNNIAWIQLPIEDDAAPETRFEKQWLAHQDDIIAAVNNQQTIAVHCKGGSGRTGLVISLILLSLGWKSDDVKTAVQKIRPNSLINEKQLSYFQQQS